MQAHRLNDSRTKVTAKPVRSNIFVQIVNTIGYGVVTKQVNHVSDIVQQRCNHKRRGVASAFGQGTRLDRVHQLVHL